LLGVYCLGTGVIPCTRCEDWAVGGSPDRIAGVRVLGAVCAVAADGSVIDLPSSSQRRLLGLLALHAPSRLRSERLSDVLGVSPGALRTTVSRLRSAVGLDVLQTSSTGYALECDVDASQFCHAVAAASRSEDRVLALQQALKLWTGPALDEFVGEEWAAGEIARLTEIHAGTVDDYAEELIAEHRAADAVAVLHGHVAQYPYRDRSRALLIRSLASAGRQADALRAFQDYRSLLDEELGTEPSPEVVRTERRVATGWDGAESGAGHSTTTDAVIVPLPPELAHRSDFIGRVAERDLLGAELAATRSGLRCVILGGEPGIGKTTLLAEFAQSAMSKATVLYGRCDETGIPLEPFRTVLDACVEHASLELLTDHVARCGGELARIAPRLWARVATAPRPTRSDDATERFLAFTGAADLLSRLAARRPLVLLLDDLQWAEPTALLLVRHLARALIDAPVLLVSSVRDPGEPVSDELRQTLAVLERGEVRRVQLNGMGDDELASLAAAVAPAGSGTARQHAVSRLRVETAGNPLYASQLIAHWVEAGSMGGGNSADDVPPNLREVVWSRVHALGNEVSQVLAAASVLGVEVHENVLLEMLDFPETTVRAALDSSVVAGILVDLGSVRRTSRFVHALIAKSLYSQIGPSTRAHLHENAVRSLVTRHPVPPPDVVVQLARHCALAGLASEALDWSVRAGEHAFAHLAPIEAARHFRIALDIAVELDRPDTECADLLVRLGEAQHVAGDPEALATLEKGAELAGRTGSRGTLIRAVLAADRGFTRIDIGAPSYLAMVEAAVAAADPTDTTNYARLLGILAGCLMNTERAERRTAFAHQALTLAEATGSPTLLAQVGPAVVTALWGPGAARLRGRVAARALTAAEATGDPHLQFRARLTSYHVAVESADPIVASRSLVGIRSAVRSLGEPRLRWIVGLIDAFDAMMTGRLDEAQSIATANLDLGLQIGMPDAFSFFAGQFFVIGTFAGNHDELFPLVEQAQRDNPEFLPFKVAYGIICAAVGRRDEARGILSEGMAGGFADLPRDIIWMTVVVGYAVLAIDLDDVEAAAQLLPIIKPYAGEVAFNGITSQGPIAAYIGKLASLLGHHDLAEDHLRSALATAEGFGWTYHRATTLFALAEGRHRLLGSLDAEGRLWLSEAAKLCRAYGFRSWTGRIDALAVE
jgi:DNA-binding SARP family transcriptional activator